MSATFTRDVPAQSFQTGAIKVAAPGAGNKASNQLAVGENPQRRSFVVVNSGTVNVFLTAGSGVDPTDGFLLLPGAGLVMGHGEAVFCFVAFGQTVDGELSFYSESGERGA